MLFPSLEPALPEGFQYRPEWISPTEEQDLLERVETVAFSEVRMHGVVAKRRVAHFGWDYGYESWRITATEPIPLWLMPLRERVGTLMALPADQLEEVLITRYEAGAGIGWHRDAPMFGPIVAGLSLLAACRMRFQRKTRTGRETAEWVLEPRSAYVLSGQARLSWQHSIPPTKALRYSITFRTVNPGRRDGDSVTPRS
jgi:DNA oxidative demethylase